MAKSCVKIVLIVLNVLMLLIGLAVLGSGLWLYFDKVLNHLRTGESVKLINIILFVIMGIGGVICLIALCGCCGALYMNQCLLAIYFTILLILFLVHIGIALVGLFASFAVNQIIVGAKGSTKALVELAVSNDTLLAKWNEAQSKMGCCGDARGSNAFPTNKMPSSCCMDTATIKLHNNCTINYAVPNCAELAERNIRKYYNLSLIVIFVVAAIQLLAMIFSMVLCCNARRYQEEGYIGVGVVA